MGKKKVAILGSENEDAVRAKRDVQREQKKKRAGKKDEIIEVPEVVDLPAGQAEIQKEKIAKAQKVRTKRYVASKTQVDIEKLYPLEDAIKLLRSISYSSANSTIELHINLKDKGFSKEVELPFSTGKIKKVAIADDATLAKIEKGVIDFDVLLTTPTNMAKLVKFAKVLGPRGLMPNPKNGTVVDDPEKKAKDMLGKNTLVLKTEKEAAVIHTSVGKLAMTDTELSQNTSAVLSALPIGKVTKAVLKSTMSPAIKLILA